MDRSRHAHPLGSIDLAHGKAYNGLLIAVAAGGCAVTVTKSKIFQPLREFAWSRSRWLGMLLYCPYCMAHWLVFAGVAIYRPRLLQSRAAVVDVFISMLAIITAACFVSALLIIAYKSMFDGDPPPGYNVSGEAERAALKQS